ncbi:MAG: CHAT domain-containing protein, partial [Tepidiformaceae bacterium]
ATTGGDESPDPPRSSFALLNCPEVVVAAEPFELLVGLAAEQQEGVSGGELVRPPTSVGDYVLTIQLVADGFTLATGETWRNALAVTTDTPYPSIRLHLTPDLQERHVVAGAVQAVYSVNGHTMGLAVRSVAVVRSAALAEATVPPTVANEGVEIAIPVAATAADLTVRIQKAASTSGGKLMWTFDSPHKQLDLPDETVVTDIGDEPESFVRQLITGISVHEGNPGLHAYLTGVGLTIADQMPVEFWALLRAVATLVAAESRPPTIFLLSEEPYVPWELAIVDEPLGTEAVDSRFLGAQASVGRWVLAERRPKLPAPLEVSVGRMAVVSGVYDQPGWDRLLDAEAEAAELCQRYGGSAVTAEPRAVLRCLGGDPVADLLHFSVHGVYDPRSTTDGLVLVDGSSLDPFQVKGLALKSSPFVFLNACQVGAGSKLLGDYAGMAEAFLYAGASGVIAPLWSINDALARGVASRFYEKAFAGSPPAEVMRAERGGFGEDSPSATALAYLYYGHPSLRLRRPPQTLPGDVANDHGPG